MKTHFYLSAFLSFLTFSSAFAFERPNEIVMDWVAQDEKNPDDKDLIPVPRTLTELNDSNLLESDHFKVVLGTFSEAIRLDDKNLSEKTLLRARTAYYHLTAAHAYYDQSPEFQNPLFRNNIVKKIVVRIDMDHMFSPVTHWQKRVLDPNAKDFSTYFSGSLTVQASDNTKIAVDSAGKPLESWGNEIWYSLPQKNPFPSTLKQVSKMLNQKAFKNNLRGALLYSDLLSFQNEVLRTHGDPEWVPNLLTGVWSLLLAEATPRLFQAFSLLDHPYQSLDSAQYPETSYHEYTHVVLGGIFNFQVSTSLNEGFPNYMAKKILGRATLLPKIRGLSHNLLPKKSNSKKLYSFDQDFKIWAAQGSFVFSLLSDLDQSFKVQGFSLLVQSLLELKKISVEKQTPAYEETIAILQEKLRLVNTSQPVNEAQRQFLEATLNDRIARREELVNDTRTRLYIRPDYTRALDNAFRLMIESRSSSEQIDLWTKKRTILYRHGLVN